MRGPRKGLYGILMLMAGGVVSARFFTRLPTRYVQRCEPGSGAGIPELDEIIFAARDKQAHRWVPFDALDVPSVAGKNTLLTALRERPDAHGRVVTGCGEACVVWRETKSAYGFAMGRPRREVVHVGLEILDDSRLVCRRNVRSGMVEGQCADGRIVCLQDCLKVERQPIPGCELPTRGTRQYPATFWCPLGSGIRWTKLITIRNYEQ